MNGAFFVVVGSLLETDGFIHLLYIAGFFFMLEIRIFLRDRQKCKENNHKNLLTFRYKTYISVTKAFPNESEMCYIKLKGQQLNK